MIIGSKNKKIFSQKPFLHDVRYYLVANTKDPRNVAECHGPTVLVSDFESNRSIGICTYYQASCRPGNEEIVVLALFSNSHPGEELNNLITELLLDHTRNQETKFFDNYHSEQASLQKLISDRVFHKVGLDLKVRISLDGEEKLQPIVLGPLFVPVRVKDQIGKELDLKISATLQVEEKNKIKALLRKWILSDLENFIQEGTKKHITDYLKLEQFYNELHTGELRRNLINILNPALNELTGYRLEHLLIEHGVAAAPKIEDFFEMEQEVECKIQEYPKPVTIKNTLQMILEDIGKYKACQSPRLNLWAKESLERIIHESLFDARYIDLLINFEQREQEIKTQMSKKAQAIGYRIKYLITVPDIEHRKLRENFTIDTEGSFATKFSDVLVKLQIVVVARVNDLTSVKKYFNRQDDVISLMRETFLAEARQYLHTIDPEVFYMDFFHSRTAGERSVEKKLGNIITSCLKRNFGAEVIKVISKVLDTELMERFKKLKGQLCPFEVEVESLHSGDYDSVKFMGRFQILGVDQNGWHTFQSREYAIEKIREYVEENIRGILGTQENPNLKYKDPKHLAKITSEINSFVKVKISEAFGLLINIIAFYREKTHDEKNFAEVKKLKDETQIAKLKAGLLSINQDQKTETEKSAIAEAAEKEQLKELYLRRKKLISMDVIDEEALKEVDVKIKELKGDRQPLSLQDIDEELRQLEQHKRDFSHKELSIGGFSNLLNTGNQKSDSESNQEKGQKDE